MVYRLPTCTDKTMHLARIKQFAGTHFVEQALELASVVDDLRLWGWVAPPNPLQKTGPLHYFFINGRAIKDKVVTHALQQAFMSVFPQTTHNTMAYVLYFELDPEQIDINVHPAKQEVRFREPRRVHAFLSQTVESAFRQGFFGLSCSAEQTLKGPPAHQSTLEYLPKPVLQYAPTSEVETSNTDNGKLSSLPPFNLSAFQHKTILSHSRKSMGAGLQHHATVRSPKIHLGDPLCVIRHRWLLSDNGEDLFLIDISLASQALTKEPIDIAFFSLKECTLLIRQLEACAHSEKLHLASIVQQCHWPITHLHSIE
jgi:DNA mismatch repair protein MutL